MLDSVKFQEYLNTVCTQIRWKKSHNVITKELKNHLDDQKVFYIEQGMNDEDSEQKAIESMGNPIEIGAKLDRAYRPKNNIVLFLLMVVMLIVGVIVRISVASATDSTLSYFSMIAYIAVGLALFGLIILIDYSNIIKFSGFIYIGFIGIFIITCFFETDSYRIPFSSYLLLLFPVATTGIICNFHSKGMVGVILSGFVICIPLSIAVFIPSFSGMIIFGITMLIIVTYMIMSNKFGCNRLLAMLFVYIPITILACIFVTKSYPRFMVALHPTLDPHGNGWLGLLVRGILENANFVGQSAMEFELPSSNTDYLLTFLIYKFGWIAFIAVSVLLLAVIVYSIRMCIKQRSFLGRSISISIVSVFSLQIIFYIMNNLGITLFTEFPLPFINGDTSIIVNLLLMGILMSVFRSDCLILESKITSKNILERVSMKLLESFQD